MPSNGSDRDGDSGTTTAQLMRELVDQMRQVQDTVAALAKDNTTLKAQVAVLEASVERLQGAGGAAKRKQGDLPESIRHSAPPEANSMVAAAAPLRGQFPAPAGGQPASNRRTPRGHRGSEAGRTTASQTQLRSMARTSAKPEVTLASRAAGDTGCGAALPPRNAA